MLIMGRPGRINHRSITIIYEKKVRYNGENMLDAVPTQWSLMELQ
jgi:hypothetical protein